MLGMGLLNVSSSGRCRRLALPRDDVCTSQPCRRRRGFLWSLPSPTWTTIAWQVGVLAFCLDVGYLSGSAYALYRRVPRSPRLKISTAGEVSGQ